MSLHLTDALAVCFTTPTRRAMNRLRARGGARRGGRCGCKSGQRRTRGQTSHMSSSPPVLHVSHRSWCDEDPESSESSLSLSLSCGSSSAAAAAFDGRFCVRGAASK
jgi:hypothetical protein